MRRRASYDLSDTSICSAIATATARDGPGSARFGEFLRIGLIDCDLDDESFIRLMNCPEYSDSYYRVSRNSEQKSIVSFKVQRQ